MEHSGYDVSEDLSPDPNTNCIADYDYTLNPNLSPNHNGTLTPYHNPNPYLNPYLNAYPYPNPLSFTNHNINLNPNPYPNPNFTLGHYNYPTNFNPFANNVPAARANEQIGWQANEVVVVENSEVAGGGYQWNESSISQWNEPYGSGVSFGEVEAEDEGSSFYYQRQPRTELVDGDEDDEEEDEDIEDEENDDEEEEDDEEDEDYEDEDEYGDEAETAAGSNLKKMASVVHMSSSVSPQSTNPTSDGLQTHTRTYQACIPCRQRKVRCDLGPVDDPRPPPCVRCRRESKECYFSNTRRKRKADGSIDENGELEPDDYEIRNGRKKAGHTSTTPPSLRPTAHRARTSSASQENFHPPLTPGGHAGNSRPLVRPPSQTLHSSDEDEETVNNDTTKMIIRNEVFHQGDALSLLAEAGKTDVNIKRERSRSFEGPIQVGGPKMTTAHPKAVKHGRNGSLLPTAVNVNAANRAAQKPHGSNEPGRRAALQAWSKVRFVKAGWFTGAEGMSYIEYFYKFLCPMTPITVPDFRDPAKHGQLIRDEPMLALTILTIASRYYQPPGPGSVSRAYKIHDELWKELKQKMICVILAEDKSRGSFAGAGAVRPTTPGLPPGLRSMGTIESFILLTEWHPRSVHFPGGDDNDGIMSSDENSGLAQNTADDIPHDLYGRNIDSWLSPCLRSERMCWKLLSIAMALSFELRIFDQNDCDASALADPNSSHWRGENIRKLLFIYITQTSGRLTLKSMLPDFADHSLFATDPLRRAYEARAAANPSSHKLAPELVHQVVLHFWCEVTQFMKRGNRDVFPTREDTRQLIASGEYVQTLNRLNTDLAVLRKRFDECDLVPPEMRLVLTIEFEYNRVYCNSLALQAVVEKCTQNALSGSHGSPSTSRNGQNLIILPEVLLQRCDGDRLFINEIIRGGQNVLRCVGEVLGPKGLLKFAPVRTFFRIISVSMVFLKCFTLGQRSEDAAMNLKMLDEASDALRTCIVDDVHVASRIADLLQILTQRVRSSVVRVGGNLGQSALNSRVASRAPTPPASAGALRVQQHSRPNSGSATSATADQGHETFSHHHQGPGPRSMQQSYTGTPTSAPNHTPNSFYGPMPAQSPYVFPHGPYLPPTPTPYYDDPLHGINQQDYDPMNPNHSMIPPAPFNYPNGGYAATGNNANGGHLVGNSNGMSGESGNFDNSNIDWLALPLDPLLESSGAEFSQAGLGPVLNEIDMLDFYAQQYGNPQMQ